MKSLFHSVSCIGRVCFMAALSVSALQAQTFTKITDLQSAIPSGTGNFTDLNTPACYGSTVSFYGKGSSAQAGIYTWNGGALSKVADLSTAVPSSSGNFTSISFYDYLVSSAGDTYIRGSGTSASGIYKSSGGSLSRVVDSTTAVPVLGGTFTSAAGMAESGGTLAFVGRNAANMSGIFTLSSGTITDLVDANTVLPGGTANFAASDFAYIDGGLIAFWAYKTDNTDGIYSYTSGAVHRVADRSLTMPGFGVTFGGFNSPAQVDSISGKILFAGYSSSGGYKQGLYSANPDGSGLTRLVDTATAGPNGLGNYAQFTSFRLVGNTLIFVGAGSTFQYGVYSMTGGIITKVLVPGDTLSGKTVKAANMGTFGLDASGNLALEVDFTDSSKGIYTTQVTISASQPPKFTSWSFTETGFQVNLSLTAGGNYRLQGTTNPGDPASWTTILNITDAPATVQYTDMDALNHPFRFYRVVSP